MRRTLAKRRALRLAYWVAWLGGLMALAATLLRTESLASAISAGLFIHAVFYVPGMFIMRNAFTKGIAFDDESSE